jgi:ATP-binding cassette subfamily B protein
VAPLSIEMSGLSISTSRPASDRLLLRTLVHAGPWAPVLALAALGLALAETALPFVLGRALDDMLRTGQSHEWLTLSAALVAAVVALDAIDALAAGCATARSTAWLRRRFVGHLVALGPRAGSGAGDLTGRVVANAAQAGRIAQVAARSAATVVPAIGGPIGLALIDPWLCVTFLAGMPIVVVLLRALGHDAQHLAERYLAVQGTIAGRLADAVLGARSIAAAGTLEREAARVLEPLPELHRHGLGIWRVQMRIAAQDGLLVALLEIAVLAVGGLELTHGRISAGELLAAGQYVLLGATMASALSTVTAVARARAAAERVGELLRAPPPVYGGDSLAPGRGRLELRNVTVRRDGAALLRDVSLTVDAGQLVAVVGPSGAGKSLIAALAGRLLDPDEGEVLLDGVPLARLSRHELRTAAGYGFERPGLVGDTLAEAIALGADEPPARQLIAAARAARADGFIRRLRRRYRTPLAAVPMSGGERQRLGLARAFAHAGRLLILDDVAASLDTITERHISQVLTEALGDRTRLVIAHRASTAARADRVVWIEEGRVTATGTHRELWRLAGYRALFGAGTEAAPAMRAREPA